MEGLGIVQEVGVGRCERIVARGNIQPRPRTETGAPWGQWRTRFLSSHLASTREQTDQNIQYSPGSSTTTENSKVWCLSQKNKIKSEDVSENV